MDKGKKPEAYVKQEIRREFQLERMVLFSDAVFAIVITLMAIEIHLPESVQYDTSEELAHELLHLLPNVIAYSASFLYIGFTWYQHLQVFSLLKDYDKGLVVRNLLMLFFIGFIPFSVSLVARSQNGMFLTAVIYFSVILLSKGAQLLLHHYILVKRPQLRNHGDIGEELMRFKNSRMVIILLSVMFLLTTGTMHLIKDPELKPFGWWWFIAFPFMLRFFKKRNKRN
jgi:uncharacterized membrane protein